MCLLQRISCVYMYFSAGSLDYIYLLWPMENKWDISPATGTAINTSRTTTVMYHSPRDPIDHQEGHGDHACQNRANKHRHRVGFD